MSDRDDAPPIPSPRRASVHRVARGVTLAGLAVGAIGLLALIGWTWRVRAAWESGRELSSLAPRGFLERGFAIIALHPDYVTAAIGAAALAAAGIALAVLAWRRRRWSLLAAGVGALLVAAAPWLARAYVVRVETSTASRAWAARSPYVAAVTDAAIGSTIFLGLLAAAAITAFFTAPRIARGAPTGGDATPARVAGAEP